MNVKSIKVFDAQERITVDAAYHAYSIDNAGKLFEALYCTTNESTEAIRKALEPVDDADAKMEALVDAVYLFRKAEYYPGGWKAAEDYAGELPEAIEYIVRIV